MEEYRSSSGQNLGVAALITAIITFVIAVIPCVGILGIVTGVVAIVLASVGLSQANRTDSPKGVILAGLIIAVVAIMISFSQIFVAGRIFNKEKWPHEVRSVFDEVTNDVKRDLENSNVSIKIESNGDTVEIRAVTDRNSDKVKKLEELETGKDLGNDTLNSKK
ncbi:MAG: hypothetical protein U0X39_02885 [Bacteroidales bacterium]